MTHTKQYIQDRDEAAEKFAANKYGIPTHYRETEDFKSGSDWATARAEEKVKGLVEALKKCKVKFQIIENPLEYMGAELDTEASISDLEARKAGEGVRIINEALKQYETEKEEG